MAAARRVVLKFGTGILTSGGGVLDVARVSGFCRDIAKLREQGTDFVIVSSGAVGLGMGKLGLQERPAELEMAQACAAIGQAILIQTWQRAFDPFGIPVAQILLTREDLRGRRRHLAARATIEQLLSLGVVPIINENDTISAEEIKFGDNDLLSALTASFIHAELLVILSTAPGLMENPEDGAIVPVVEQITPEIEGMAGGTRSATAVGGMISKIEAAKVAMRSGTDVVICSGEREGMIADVLTGEERGTLFRACEQAMPARKRWIAYFENISGRITVDEGAQKALADAGRSLLLPGIVEVAGEFEAGDKVEICGEGGIAFARGLVGQDAGALRKLLQAKQVGGEATSTAAKESIIIHRDQLVLL